MGIHIVTSGGSESLSVLKKFKKDMGDGVAHMGNEALSVLRIPTGILSLDVATNGGIPRNRVSIAWGSEASGKTAIAYLLMAQVQREGQRAVYVDMEHCMAEDSELLDVTTGVVYTARQVYENKIPLTTVAFDGDGLVVRPISSWFDEGIRPLIKVSTGNTSIKVTENEKLLIYTGNASHKWIRADELRLGMKLCRPRKIRDVWPATCDVLPQDARIIGYLIGDGHFPEVGATGFTNDDPDIVSDLAKLCLDKGAELSMQKGTGIHYRIRGVNGKAKANKWDRSPVKEMCRRYGLLGIKSSDKTIPAQIFSGSPDVVGQVLSGLYLTDGSVNSARPALSYSTTSRNLAIQMRYLWAKFGIVARINEVTNKTYVGAKLLYQVTLNGRRNLRKASSVLTLVGKKKAALAAWCDGVDKKYKPCIGEVYPEYYELTQRARMANYPEYINQLGVYWEDITGLESVGEGQTYDFSVEGLQNLLVNDIVVHNTLDPAWTALFGVNMSDLIVLQPDFAEQAVDMVEAMLYASDVGIVVVDSIAAMTTDNEIASSAQKMNVGGNSYVVGKLIRKSVVALGKGREHRPALFLINQSRFKIGCFDYYSKVWLADGTTKNIGAIVSKKLPVEVLSKDADGNLIARRVIGWSNNGDGDDWIKLVVAGGNNGRRFLRVTRGHTIFTPNGEVIAGDLKVGDLVTTAGIQYYSPEQHDVILGSIFGDGSLRFEKGSTRGHLRVGHGPKQLAYNEYKASLFGASVRVGKTKNEFCTERSLEFSEYGEISKTKGLRHVPQKFVDRLTLRALAIWYLDDGNYSGTSKLWGWGKPTLSLKTLDTDSLLRLSHKIAELGAGQPTCRAGVGFLWSGRRAMRLLSAIAPYAPKCMSYKFKAGMILGQKSSLDVGAPTHRVFQENVVSIEDFPGVRCRYDLTVEGDHNYLVNGVVVHNTMYGDPLQMPGGNALKFASSMTLRLYGKLEIEKDVNPVNPTFLHVTGSIQKAKVPVTSRAFEYDLTLIPHGNLGIGMSPSWNFVAAKCKDIGLMTQDPKGDKAWTLCGKTAKTQKELRHWYETDKDYSLLINTIITKEAASSGVFEIDPEPPSAFKIDKETGEILSG